jgi:hypothetical protein
MRPACIAVAAIAGLIVSSGARAEEFHTQSIPHVPLPPVKEVWHTQASPADNHLIATFTRNDGSELSVICNTDDKRLTITYRQPEAKWTAGEGINVITLPDSGQQPSPSYGLITGPTQVVLKHDPTFDLWTMAQAKDTFKLSVGDFARVFPAANFRRAVDPVLKACGNHW